MEIKNTFAYFRNKANYEAAKSASGYNGDTIGSTSNTIVFVEGQGDTPGEIWTHGKQFGGGISESQITNAIKNYFNNQENVEDVLPIASYTNKGIVSIQRNGGINVNNGVISANIPEIIAGIKGADGQDGLDGLVKTIWEKIKGTPGENGLKGDPGEDGQDGTTPRIENGYWWIGDVNTQVKASGTEITISDDGYWVLDGTKTNVKATGGNLEGDYVKSVVYNTNSNKLSIVTVSNGVENTEEYEISNEVGNGEPEHYLKAISKTSNGNNINVTVTKEDNTTESFIVPGQYIKAANYENRVLTLTPNSGETVSVAIPQAASTGSGTTYYGGTGIYISENNNDNYINTKTATRNEQGAVKIWEKDNTVTIDGITLGSEDSRYYPLKLDSNGIGYVRVPWSDTTFDPVNNEYINNKLNEATQRQNELSERMEGIADNLATIVDEDFQQKLTQARNAIDDALEDLDRLHELLDSDVVLRTDPVQVKLAEFLDRGNNSYYTFDEAIDLTLLEKLSDENPEATVYQKVLKIVKDNSVDGEIVNGRIDSAVTNVKDEITVDLEGYAKKQFVAETVSTQVDAAKNEVYDTYSDAGLSIDSRGRVKIDASKAKFTNGDVQEQSLSEIINDATDGIIATAATKDWVNEKLANSGLILGTDGSFSLLSQLRKLLNGNSGDLESLAGIIGSTNSMGGKIEQLAESKITGAKASIIAEARGDGSWIELTADQITLNGETIANKINALNVTTGNLSATNANVQSRLTAAEAKITSLEATTINADLIKSKLSESKYLALVKEKDNAPDDIAALTSDGVFFAQGEIQTDETWATWNTSLENLFNQYSSLQKNGVYIYPEGKDDGYGAMIQSIPVSLTGTKTVSGLWLSDQTGTALMLPEQIILSDKTQTGLADWNANLVNDNLEYIVISKDKISSRWKDSNLNVCSAYIGDGGIHIANNTKETGIYLHENGYLRATGTNQELRIDGGSLEIRNTITNKYLSINSDGIYSSSLANYENPESEGGSEVFKVICSDPDVNSAFITDGLIMAIVDPTTMEQKGVISSDSISGFTSIKVGDGNEIKHTIIAGQPTLTMTSVGNIELKADINTPNSSTELALTAEGGIYCNDRITATGFITDSDRNKKNIISDTTLTVDQVADAPAVNFTYKDSNNTDEQVGTIAQYWQVVLPQVVGSRQDGTLTMNYGNAAMVSSIVTAKEVVALKERIAELERKLNELTSNQ